MGKLLQWLINEKNRTFYGMKLPTGFQLIGQTTLKQYQDWLVYFDRQHRLESHYVSRKTMKAYARVGVRFFSLFVQCFRLFSEQKFQCVPKLAKLTIKVGNTTKTIRRLHLHIFEIRPFYLF